MGPGGIPSLLAPLSVALDLMLTLSSMKKMAMEIIEKGLVFCWGLSLDIQVQRLGGLLESSPFPAHTWVIDVQGRP